eukprot:3714877-Rhodomonas_salina.2
MNKLVNELSAEVTSKVYKIHGSPTQANAPTCWYEQILVPNIDTVGVVCDVWEAGQDAGGLERRQREAVSGRRQDELRRSAHALMLSVVR